MSRSWDSQAERHPERTCSSFSGLAARPQSIDHSSTEQSSRNAALRLGSLCSDFLVTRGSRFRPRRVWLHLAGLVGLCLELPVLFLKCSVLREGGGGGGLVQFDKQAIRSLFRSGEFVTAEFHWSHNSLWNLIWSEVFHYMCMCDGVLKWANI